MRLPRRRFREERSRLYAADDVRKARELQRAYALDVHRTASLPLR